MKASYAFDHGLHAGINNEVYGDDLYDDEHGLVRFADLDADSRKEYADGYCMGLGMRAEGWCPNCIRNSLSCECN